MKQYVGTYQFRHSLSEISKNISEVLSANPGWSVHTISTVTYETAATGRSFDAIVVYNIERPQDTLDTPKLVGGLWARASNTSEPIPSAKGGE